MECKKDENFKKCNCTYEPCPGRGMCCECLRYHLSHDELPGCVFPPEIEKTYDRSIKNFVKYYAKKYKI